MTGKDSDSLRLEGIGLFRICSCRRIETHASAPIREDVVPIPFRYFAPEGEVDFCGHATIATAVAIGATVGLGAYTLSTKVGPVGIVARLDGTRSIGTLRSPAVDCFPLEQGLLSQLLDGLHWSVQDLDPDLPPAVGWAIYDHWAASPRGTRSSSPKASRWEGPAGSRSSCSTPPPWSAALPLASRRPDQPAEPDAADGY